MEKTKKIKLFIGLFYLILVGVFLLYFFSKFSIQEITSYDFIKNNRDYFFSLRENNLFLLSAMFFYSQLFGFVLLVLVPQLRFLEDLFLANG